MKARKSRVPMRGVALLIRPMFGLNSKRHFVMRFFYFPEVKLLQPQAECQASTYLYGQSPRIISS